MAKSPLYGAYESGAGAKAYVSNRQAFQQLQNDIVAGAKEADRLIMLNKVKKGEVDIEDYNRQYPKEKEKDNKDSAANMLGECPKGKVRSKINKKCVSKKGAGKEYDK